MNPLVSVVVPSFNHRRFVGQNIDSILGQTYPEIELIVVDDCSTDGSREYLREASEGRGFRLVENEKNLGLNATLERGIAEARGEYISLLASDDMLCPSKIETELRYLQRTGKQGVYSTGYVLHEDGRRVRIDLDWVERAFADGTILERVYVDDSTGPLLQSALFRTPVLREAFAERRPYRSDDWALLIIVLERYEVGFLNEPLFYYRQHGENSYRNYWKTLPMRAEVICSLTPERLRPKALANLLASQALYLAGEGKVAPAARLAMGAFALDPSPARIARGARFAAATTLRRLRRALMLAPAGGRVPESVTAGGE